jgi:N-acetylglutamate synthase-like GNAT family acetyltransferase
MMMEIDLTIRPATREDLKDIFALLDVVDLPRDGVEQYLSGFLAAIDTNCRLVGTIGLERHGKLGLLRSAAVAPGLQRSGLGSQLTQKLIARAAAQGIDEIILLTSTARDFFAKRFGFVEVDRADYADQLAGSPEWGLPRCASAVLMKLKLHAAAA